MSIDARRRTAIGGRTFDAIVVGSGPTGGWVAKELTEGGLDVAVLEAGPPIDLNAPSNDAKMARQPVQRRHDGYHAQNRHLFVDDVENPYTTPSDQPFEWIRGRQVGGRSLTWGRVAVRLSDYHFSSGDDFGEEWPISASDLAPCYEKVERFLGITTSTLTPAERHFKKVVEARWPHRRVTSSRAIPLSRTLDGATFPIFTSNGSTLMAAARTGRLTLQPNTIARCILIDARDSRARGVACVERVTGAELEIYAPLVLVCASTIESTRLLLNSATTQHPNGLGNSSGLLGRYLADHMLVRVQGTAPGYADAEDDFGGENAIMLPRFRNLEQRERAFVRGYGIFGGIQRRGIPESEARDAGAPLLLTAVCEQLSYADNRVTLASNRKDAFGIPSVHIESSYRVNEREMAKDAVEQIAQMAEAAQFSIDRNSIVECPPGWSVHEVGTARMGNDRKRAVLTAKCRIWDVPNVIVPDGSCWVSATNIDPTLTMMAIAVYASQCVLTDTKRKDL